MKRITDFRVGELRIPAERFPLPPRVAQMLRLYSGPGQWESNVAVFFPSTAWPKLRPRCWRSWRTPPAIRSRAMCQKPRQRRAA
jgi:hypothetical protein